MAPKISSVLGFHEREQLHKNPSILAYTGDVGQNYLDLGDGYEDQEREQAAPAEPHGRSRTDAEKKKVTTRSRLTSISSSLLSARTAVTTRAKKFHVRESTRQAISQLRKTMTKGASFRTETKESVASDRHQSNQFDNDQLNSDRLSNDHFADVGNQVGVESAGFECMYAEVSLGNALEFRHSSRDSTPAKGSRLSKLLPPRAWIKSAKQKQRSSDELYMY
ncbi:hypothetical protein PF005_g2961 [Phytophthora fragariae]|uniref:Uncharacterized protein n=1 Tax=Phytophthora fragariae TaxID=53985 RepID=A0A6A3UMA1_9STRA|nr:hypothetical protein PF003_g14467 [Phytophthora fragariae]KAE8946893.1 hypothetical protein PF009_g3479 [Phytophthora fragariae]KAE9026224.1 hypothetical protein PF011_g2651 [Phytophthora fragariae]KAE9133926.1 hypothetical protein PF010_g2620 [Phytophthora fragariae]KAE9134274.1 hypothetical protein PF007_g2982 [Phytophthora fragariae]